jgi:hypothetical protein
MKLLKELMLGGATIILPVVAQAADLSSYKSAPIQYVRVCDAYGTGFFYIPGTDTCLRVGGYTRFEFRYQPGHDIYNVKTGTVSQAASAEDDTGMRIRGRIYVDAQTPTQWGTVETYARLRAANDDGIRAEGGTSEFLTSYSPGGNKATVLTMERAYIRFAGVTAGLNSENLNAIPAYMFGPGAYPGFPNGIKQLAYTATLGGGISTTVALESKADFTADATTAGDGTLATSAGTPLPYAYGVTYANRLDSGFALVGNIRRDVRTGFFQIAGAVKNNTIDGVTLGSPGPTSDYNPLHGSAGMLGWAASFSFRYNLPMLGSGDRLHFQAVYGRGIDGLVQDNGSFNNLSNSTGANRWLGGIITVPTDIIATSASSGVVNSVAETQALSVYGVFTHYWTQTWRSNVQAGYLRFWAPAADPSVGPQVGGVKVFDTAANLIWSPTTDFDIGVEVDYAHLSQTIQNAPVVLPAAALHSDGIMGTLRLQRDF